MKPLSLILAIICFILLAAWQFLLKDSFNQRFPDNWHWEVSSLGYSSFAPESGQFPEGTSTADDPLNLTERRVTVQTGTLPEGQVLIIDHYSTKDPISNAITWEVNFEATVDQSTGRYLEGEFAGQNYFLPSNLDKNQTYAITNTSYRNLPMSFQREELVNGINTYLYAFHGDLPNATAYPDISLEANQTITCFDFSLEYWAEPSTGEIVKFREWCEGDYLVDTSTNQPLYAVSRWGAETTSDDLLRRTNEVKEILFQWQLRNLYLPLALAVLGVGFLIFGLLPRKANP